MTVDEDTLRELLHRTSPLLRGVTVDDVAALLAREGASGARRRRGAVAALAAAAVVAALAVTAALVHPDHAHSPPTRQPPTDYGRLVLRDGDTVRVSGEVQALPGQPTRLCNPNVVTTGDGAVVPSSGSTDRKPCFYGIEVTRVDLRRLAARSTTGASITGFARVMAIYRHNQLSVTSQQATTPAPPHEPSLDDRYPCVAPPGGWRRGNGQVDFDPIDRYRKAHPGTILDLAQLQPARDVFVPYVLTVGDPAPVRAALNSSFPNGVCAARSVYTSAQIDKAVRDFGIETALGRQAGISSIGEGIGGQLQPTVQVEMQRLTPQLAQLAASEPAGLLDLSIWLVPTQ